MGSLLRLLARIIIILTSLAADPAQVWGHATGRPAEARQEPLATMTLEPSGISLPTLASETQPQAQVSEVASVHRDVLRTPQYIHDRTSSS